MAAGPGLDDTAGVPDLTESVTVSAPPDVVWKLISDVRRMGEFSPETTSCHWLNGATAAAVGAEFSGSNRNGLHRWSTKCTVTAADPGRSFGFRVGYLGMKIADWSFDIRPTGDGCEVTESWTDRRTKWMASVGSVGTGVKDRTSHNRESMQATLHNLKVAAEKATASH